MSDLNVLLKMIPPDFFPNIPEPLREMWLDPIAAEYGWPFQSLDDWTRDSKWRYVLPKMTLRELSELGWLLERVDLASKPFTPGSLNAVQGLLQQHVLGRETLYANLANTAERFRACASFIREHRDFPAPVVLIDTGDAYDLLDGNHRFAALLHVGIPPGFEASAWVGRNPKKTKQNKPAHGNR